MRLAADILPPDVRLLVQTEDGVARDEAWARFVARHSTLLLSVSRSIVADHDVAMDSYVFVLDQLRADDYRKIRAYAADGRCKFTTWLVVVARRACIDFARHKHGRKCDHNGEREHAHDAYRRQLVSQMEDVIDPETLPDDDSARPDGLLRTRELSRILDEALAQLPTEDRLLLRFRFGDELPASEIARLLAWPTPFHVYRRLKVVFAHLRSVLSSSGVHESVP